MIEHFSKEGRIQLNIVRLNKKNNCSFLVVKLDFKFTFPHFDEIYI